MTILFFSRLFYPHIGGVEKHVYKISQELIKQGHKIIVITEQHEKRLKNKEILEGIKIYRIPIKREDWFKKFNIWFWLLKNRKLIEKANIIHCHDVFFWYLPFRFLFPQKKVFTTFHGYENYPVSKKAILVRKISEILSNRNICVGDFMKKWYHANPNAVIYGGIDLVNKNIYWKKKESAIFVGRLDEQTGIMMYAKAVEIIRKKNPHFKFTIIGDGKFRDVLKKNNEVLGFRKDVSQYLYQYRFAFVSRYLSILEAMAAKRLVFALYDNSIKEDYLKMTPYAKFIVIDNSAEKLAKKVEYFLNNKKEEEKKIIDAYGWVKNQTWEKMVNIYLKLWSKKEF